jgi:hypothetical protein
MTAQEKLEALVLRTADLIQERDELLAALKAAAAFIEAWQEEYGHGSFVQAATSARAAIAKAEGKE